MRGPDSATRDTLLGPLELLLSDPAVSHVVIDRFDRIRADRGNGLTLESLSFATPEALIDLSHEIAAQAAVPTEAASYDVSLASGLHVVAVLPAAASNGPILSIRRRPTRFDTFTELHHRGLISRSVVLKVEDALRHRRHVWLVGPSGVALAGFMASTLAACDADERVAVFERSPEVAVGDRSVICLKLGAVPIDELLERVRAFRPDRLAMHGVRDDELPAVLEVFAHRPEGNVATFEARSAKDALAAFDRASGSDVALRAVPLIVELKRTDDTKTRVSAAYDVELDASGELSLKQI
jgi:pilus assembly protein CpaF